MTLLIPPQDCPECEDVTVFPSSVLPDGNGGVLAFYRCPCGYAWACGWHLDVLGEAEAA